MASHPFDVCAVGAIYVFLDLGETLHCFALLLFQGQGAAIARANLAVAFQMQSNAVEYLCVGDAQFWKRVFLVCVGMSETTGTFHE